MVRFVCDRSGWPPHRVRVFEDTILPHALARLAPTWPDYDWGNDSPGAEHLALSVLLDATGSAEVADWWRDEFLTEVVAVAPVGLWTFSREDVLRWLVARQQRELDVRSGVQGG